MACSALRDAQLHSVIASCKKAMQPAPAYMLQSCLQCPTTKHAQVQTHHLGFNGAAGVPVKTVVADSVWQALASGNFNAVALSFGEKLSDKVEPAHKQAQAGHWLCCLQSGSG